MLKPWSVRGFALRWCLWLGLVSGGVSSTPAQEYVNFISFTNTWRYNQAGQNLGTDWVASDYDDTDDPWQSGPALFGFESFPLPGNYYLASIAPNPIPTPLSLTSQGGSNGTTITYYFRTKFTNTLASLVGVELWATNLVDDGCVIYLNGVRAGNVRLTNANPGYVTLANGGPPSEGQFDNIRLPESLLVPGENSLAVEVHQFATNSNDITFAMRLAAITSAPLVITNQPPDQVAVSVGASITLAVGVFGGPAFYQWQYNGANIGGANGPTLVINATATNQAGQYRCVITNSLSTLASTTMVSVLLDLTGPRPLEATVLESSLTNLIRINFDEALPNNAANQNPNNYQVIASDDTNHVIPFLSPPQIAGASIILRVDPASPHWVIGKGYYVVLNRVIDGRTNFIAPNTIVPISWTRHVDVLAPDAVWSFHAAATFDPAVYDEDWTAPDYIPGPWWSEGPGIFYGGPVTLPQCLGPALTLVGYQPEPVLFRTTFQWQVTNPASATFTFTKLVDDGLVLFLNGQEIYRTNAVGPVSYYSQSPGSVQNAICVPNNVTVTNLLAGTNWLAAAVVQSSSLGDVAFGLQISATFNQPSAIPDGSIPRLDLVPVSANAARLSWDGYGYALESCTNLALGSASYPNGPWIQVTNISNPYTNAMTGPARFFRLKK